MIGVLAARRHGAYSFLTCARTQTFIQRYMETLEQRIQRVAQEDVAITPYDPRWPELFRQEKGHLLNCLPNELIRRIEHFGSTAVPGLAAKGTKLTNFSSGQSCLPKGYRYPLPLHSRCRRVQYLDPRSRRLTVQTPTPP
jgi:hypothetical protein